MIADRVLDLLPPDRLQDFCRRWKVKSLALFGSALREDFRPESDIDFLVQFEDDAGWSLFDHARMEQELEDLVGRDVDLVSRRAVEASHNPLRKRAILESAETIYAA